MHASQTTFQKLVSEVCIRGLDETLAIWVNVRFTLCTFCLLLFGCARGTSLFVSTKHPLHGQTKEH